MNLRRMVAVAAVVLGGAAVPGQAAPGLPVCPIGLGVVPRTALVRLAPGADLPTSLLRSLGAVRTGAAPGLGVLALTMPTREAVPVLLADLRRRPGVEWAEADQVVRASRATNDPLLPLQWPLKVSRVSRAWDREVGVRNPVTVAVLDTGVDAAHPDLAGRVIPGYDWVNNDSDPTDDHFHGTAVSGVIAADSNNGKGVAGLSWGAQILSEKVLGADGLGSSCDIAMGIIDAARKGARVINMSLGGEGSACPNIVSLAQSVAARLDDPLLVASAGNDAAKGNPVDYPAGCPGFMGVGATDSRDAWARFSEHGSQVDISAPGVNVLTTYRNPVKHTYGYVYLSGTSLSAPMVSGAAALLLSAHPSWTSAQLEARLEATAHDLGRKGRDDFFGYGRLDVARALGL